MSNARWLGMNAATGMAITDDDHITQSITDILLTPIGSRLERRKYGSRLRDIIDAPLNPTTRLRVMSAAYQAIWLWEPRVMLSVVSVDVTGEGRAVVQLSGKRTDTGAAFTATIPLRASYGQKY